MECKALAALSATTPLKEYTIKRREVGPDDVLIKVMYCGICHTDIHVCRSEWPGFKVTYPVIAGHEVVGVVEKVGAQVKKLKVGDHAGIGCMVNSCRSCANCNNDYENYCNKGFTWTFNSDEPGGTQTYGGFSQAIVASQHFVCVLDKRLPLDKSAPLLCAGITMWAPIKFHGMDKPGLKIGVAGFGGLGHMAIKFTKSFGCKVFVISRSIGKKSDAIDNMKADGFILTTNEDEVKQHRESLDFILDTIPADHDVNGLIDLCKVGGKVVMVGVPTLPISVAPFTLIGRQKQVAGSLIGGMKETQEMLDYCAEKNIVCDIEKISCDKVNEAFERTVRADVKYRFVLDIANTLK